MGGSSSARTRDPSRSAPSSGWSPRQGGPQIPRHRQEANGCQGKGAHVSVPRPRATRAIGGLDGGHHQVIVVVRHRPSSSIRLDNDGAMIQLTNSPRLPPTHRHPVVVDATSVVIRGATRIFMDQVLSPQAPPAIGCFVCGQRGCHSSRHEAGIQPPAPSVPGQPMSPAQGSAMSAANPQSNWQRGSYQGERAPPANVPPRPQSI